MSYIEYGESFGSALIASQKWFNNNFIVLIAILIFPSQSTAETRRALFNENMLVTALA